MDAFAVVLEQPERLSVSRLTLTPPGDADVVVDVAWSGISTGTERLLYQGRMPRFPGMGYPLVPGYEAVGRIVEAGREANATKGGMVFVPGANCFEGARGLFGGAASRLVVPAARTVPIEVDLEERGVLLALAATAYHVIAPPFDDPPDLIIGHGVLGRLLARLVVRAGGPPPAVWEIDPRRAGGARGYQVTNENDDPRCDYKRICDVSGAADMLDALIGRLAPGGEIIFAGFYDQVRFAFPPAFMREARFRIAAEFKPADLRAVSGFVQDGTLNLDDLITHRHRPDRAEAAYQTAFTDPACLKMILDWRHNA